MTKKLLMKRPVELERLVCRYIGADPECLTDRAMKNRECCDARAMLWLALSRYAEFPVSSICSLYDTPRRTFFYNLQNASSLITVYPKYRTIYEAICDSPEMRALIHKDPEA